ncbi:MULTISPECIES: sensor histidine kinase [Streptomycetaceae]|uniref:sensor histidine kinase n=1 Tax=Streptomycetaceae TaxID=2062 RepID=UPI00300A9E5C
MSTWTAWPSREALSRDLRPQARRQVGRGIRVALMAAALWAVVAKGGLRPWAAVGACLGLLVLYGVVWAYFRTTLRHRLWPALGMAALLLAGGAIATAVDAPLPAVLLWCGSAVLALERLPLAAGIPVAAASLTLFVVLDRADSWLVTMLTALGVALVGYTVRLDAEARGHTQRLLAQERAARKAEAETAALAERARIAREIHDVLAHSLSAQTVHLEATRLLIERGEDREVVLERVVAARRMAREGLAETRQALSALRGEMAPVEEFLRELVASEGARLEVDGQPRRLPAEAGLTVRRVAQEAMTNVRKHAPGADVVLRLEYRPDEVELEFRDFGGRSPVDNSLGVSGSGYGLRGMRERAELLGGALDAGPVEEGFVVRLRVPA